MPVLINQFMRRVSGLPQQGRSRTSEEIPQPGEFDDVFSGQDGTY